MDEHAQRTHALLSASGASRWISCTPSAVLEDKYMASGCDKGEESIYAAEGTLAHEIAELEIRRWLGEIDIKTFDKEIKKLKKSDLFYPEMEKELESYLSYCHEVALDARVNNKDSYKVLVEQKLDYSHLVPDGFGTGDFLVVNGNTLEVIDLKFGKGHRVEAENNPQLMLYAIAAYHKFELVYDITKVKMTIVQPRLHNISTHEMSIDELLLWGESVVREKARLASQGLGEQVAGEHCHFCKVKGTCRKLYEHNIAIAKDVFADPHLLDDTELLALYKQTPMIVDWAKSVQNAVLGKALNGTKFDGYKLVEGKSNRVWTDESGVALALEKLGVEPYEKSLITVASAEKQLGKKGFVDISEFVVKPKGAPTLAPVTDKRSELNPTANAVKAFENI